MGTDIASIAVLGAGSWGTALAAEATRAGRHVVLWGRDQAIIDVINGGQGNTAYLPDVALPKGLTGTVDLGQAVQGADAVVVVTPSATIPAITTQLASAIDPEKPVVLCAKGIEPKTGFLMSEVASRALPFAKIGALSGPTFAAEVANGQPTAATVAFEDQFLALDLARALSGPALRLYASDDLVGVELGGAVKNVIAIACGMLAGYGAGENTRAALITRGLDEVRRIIVARGGRAETAMGLSGMGDLVLTCGSPQSRNMSLGMQLGQGVKRPDCFGGRPVVVEGEVNAASVRGLARSLGLTLPICEAVFSILHEGAPMERTFRDLFNRPLKSEHD